MIKWLRDFLMIRPVNRMFVEDARDKFEKDFIASENNVNREELTMSKNTIYRGNLFPRGDIKEGDLFQAVTSTGKVVRQYEFKDNDWVEKCDKKKELIYDQEEAVDFIHNKLFSFDVGADSVELTKRQLRMILDADEEYMRRKGIIEEE